MNLRLLVILAIIGLIGFLFVAVNAPFKDQALNILYPKPDSKAAANVFELNWDLGSQSAPLPWSDPQVDLILGSNNDDAVMDGQTIPGSEGYSTDHVLELGHGPNCQPPMGNNPTSLNNHNLTVDFDLQSFQQNMRPKLVYVCDNHLMTISKAGYGVSSFMPRYKLDWTSSDATIEFDANAYAFGREWWGVYIVPENEMLLEMVETDQGANGEQLPKRGVKFDYYNEKPSGQLIDNYVKTYSSGSFQQFRESFPNDPAWQDPRILRRFRMTLNKTNWKFQVEVAANAPTVAPSGVYETLTDPTTQVTRKYWTWTGTFPSQLSFTTGLVRVEHHSKNPSKDGIFGIPWSQYTYHWDNFKMSPATQAHTAFEAGPVFVDLFRGPDPNFFSPPVTIKVNVPQSDIKNARLVGHIDSQLARDDTDPINATSFEQVRINGGAWLKVEYVKNVSVSYGARTWTTFRNTATNIVSGDNKIEFRYPSRPAGATWPRDGFRVKDIEIQIDPVGGLSTPGPTNTPTTPASPTIAPTQAPTAVPTPVVTPPPGSMTVTFDDLTGQNQVLTGQYPSGVLDWGSGTTWFHSGPFELFTTKNVSFNGANITSGAMSLLGGRRLVSLDAYNGGTVASTITLSCTGQTTKSFTVNAKQLQNLVTNWTSSCTPVTISSSNGWNTNFDNLVVSNANATTPPTAVPTPTKTPNPTPTQAPTPAPLQGDADGNGTVNIFDYNIVMRDYGLSGTGLQGDLDRNGMVNIFDYNILLRDYGKSS